MVWLEGRQVSFSSIPQRDPLVCRTMDISSSRRRTLRDGPNTRAGIPRKLALSFFFRSSTILDSRRAQKTCTETKGELLLFFFLTNLHLITHSHNVGHSNTNTVPACAVFWLGCAIPAHQAPSESTRKCPKALNVHVSAANPHWGLSQFP